MEKDLKEIVSQYHFSDIAGYEQEKKEIVEIKDFLLNPNKYSRIGARLPKGVLLHGDPGTGKTLFVKALAGEAHVPFYPLLNMEYDCRNDMVKVVKDIFDTARKNAPSIIFVDEIDRVCHQSDVLQQLIIEMDGIQPNCGVIVFGTTNQIRNLDRPLIRSGRFDRVIELEMPSFEDRLAIFSMYLKNYQVEEQIDLDHFAELAVEFSGADINSLINDAALLSIRDGKETISSAHLEEAMDRLKLGIIDKSYKLSSAEKLVLAYHEAGHALVSLQLNPELKINKITIKARSYGGGIVSFLEDERYLKSKADLVNSIKTALGGRAAEEIVYNTFYDGGKIDLKQAIGTAKNMLITYGMSDLKYIYPRREDLHQKIASDSKYLDLDMKLQEILDDCYENSKQILIQHRDLLDRLAHNLCEKEELTREDLAVYATIFMKENKND